MSDRSPLHLSDALIGTAETWLGGLIDRADIRAAMMSDNGGYVFASSGRFNFLPADQVGAIIAASYSALGELASMTAASGITVKFHDSPIGAVMISRITDHVIFAVIFNEMGVDESAVRTRMRQVIDAMRETFDAESETVDDIPARPPLSSLLYIEDKLDELFQDF